MLMGIQVISLVFAILMMYVIFINYKKKALSLKEYLFWQIIWIGFIVLVLFPNLFKFIIGTFKITRVLDLAMIVAFMILTILGFSNYLRHKKIQKQIEKIIEKIALNEKKKIK